MGFEVRLEDVHHTYGHAEDIAEVHALEGVTLTIPAGSFAILMGPSGSGKSTLLNLMGAVDRPTAGRIHLDDTEISRLREAELTLLRRHSIGFIFQFFNLIPTLDVRENIAFPLSLAGRPRSEIRERVDAALDEVGLTARAQHSPHQLSGGEAQRVAIGRAIVHRPSLILADEPTGNLDSHTGEKILELIRRIHQSHDPTIVMATHSHDAASFGDFVLQVVDGRIRGESAA